VRNESTWIRCKGDDEFDASFKLVPANPVPAAAGRQEEQALFIVIWRIGYRGG